MRESPKSRDSRNVSNSTGGQRALVKDNHSQALEKRCQFYQEINILRFVIVKSLAIFNFYN